MKKMEQDSKTQTFSHRRGGCSLPWCLCQDRVTLLRTGVSHRASSGRGVLDFVDSREIKCNQKQAIVSRCCQAIGSDDPSLTDPEDQLGEVEAADVSPFKHGFAVACLRHAVQPAIRCYSCIPGTVCASVKVHQSRWKAHISSYFKNLQLVQSSSKVRQLVVLFRWWLLIPDLGNSDSLRIEIPGLQHMPLAVWATRYFNYFSHLLY